MPLHSGAICRLISGRYKTSPSLKKGVPDNEKNIPAATAEPFCRKELMAGMATAGTGTMNASKLKGMAIERRVFLPKNKQQMPKKSRRKATIITAR